MKTFRFLLSIAFATASIITVASANAQFPDRPIRLVVPWPAGGGTDVVSRLIASGLGEVLRAPVVVENMAGANGAIGAREIVRATPDGYALLMGTSGALIVPGAVTPEKLPFDPIKDLAAISMVGNVPLVMLINPTLPAKNFEEFLAYVKSNPGKVSIGISVGDTSHLAWEWFQSITQTKLVLVPYKGATPWLNDAIAGHINGVFNQASTSQAFIRNGKLRALALTSLERIPQLPEVPTMHEMGYLNFTPTTQYFLMGPKGLTPSTVKVLSEAMSKVLGSKVLQEKFSGLGVVPIASTPESTAEFLRGELERWRKIARERNIKIEE